MKLTEDQIAELYKFTRAHFVEHYDLQTELVDHLANGRKIRSCPFKTPLRMSLVSSEFLVFMMLSKKRAGYAKKVLEDFCWVL